jgi:tRNA threonylcarbamoyladenosine biosynthesis protein TsaE
MAIFICRSEGDLVRAAKDILVAYPASRIFAFYGKMGSGKTTFIKVLCRELGVPDLVQSPSFSIINEYKTHSGDAIFHFDFFRINKVEEVFDIGYEEYLYSGSWCFLEWPELIGDLLPEESVNIRITEDPQTSFRHIEF